uniref:Uncharacterized protein n=1 Tax=Anguilla anguilla TaxID=7936 RepID=A0A0E9PUG3_ANGAN
MQANTNMYATYTYVHAHTRTHTHACSQDHCRKAATKKSILIRKQLSLHFKCF